MTTSTTRQSVSRRTALAGLGAGGLGLALAATAHPAAAQEGAGDLASHPLVGLWQLPIIGPDAPVSPWAFQVYHADGTMSSWNAGLTAGVLGLWRPTGERTADVLWVTQDVADDGAALTITFRHTFEVDETGDRWTATGDLDIRDANGVQVAAIPGLEGTSTRVTFDVNPATGSTASQAPDAAATPTT
jgi:hypothetical protein